MTRSQQFMRLRCFWYSGKTHRYVTVISRDIWTEKVNCTEVLGRPAPSPLLNIESVLDSAISKRQLSVPHVYIKITNGSDSVSSMLCLLSTTCCTTCWSWVLETNKQTWTHKTTNVGCLWPFSELSLEEFAFISAKVLNISTTIPILRT